MQVIRFYLHALYQFFGSLGKAWTAYIAVLTSIGSTVGYFGIKWGESLMGWWEGLPPVWGAVAPVVAIAVILFLIAVHRQFQQVEQQRDELKAENDRLKLEKSLHKATPGLTVADVKDSEDVKLDIYSVGAAKVLDSVGNKDLTAKIVSRKEEQDDAAKQHGSPNSKEDREAIQEQVQKHYPVEKDEPESQ